MVKQLDQFGCRVVGGGNVAHVHGFKHRGVLNVCGYVVYWCVAFFAVAMRDANAGLEIVVGVMEWLMIIMALALFMAFDICAVPGRAEVAGRNFALKNEANAPAIAPPAPPAVIYDTSRPLWWK